jgi:hypothetical protein
MRRRISPIPPLQRPSIVNFAFYQLLDNGSSRTSATRAVAILIFAAVVIRAELAALLGSFALQLLLDSRISLTRLIKVGLFFSLVAVGMSLFCPPATARVYTLTDVTVLIDSYFWDQWPLWPELFSIYFNVYEGKSAEWGARVFFIRLLRHLTHYSGISILDIHHNPPAPSDGDHAVHPDWFYTRRSHPVTRLTPCSLYLPHEIPRA